MLVVDLDFLAPTGLQVSRYPGLGVPYEELPAGSPLLEDMDGSDGPGDEYRIEAITLPSDGELIFHDDGSLAYLPGADGHYVAVIEVFKNGASQGEKTLNFFVGPLDVEPDNLNFAISVTGPTVVLASTPTLAPRDMSFAKSAARPTLAASAMSIAPSPIVFQKSFARPLVGEPGLPPENIYLSGPTGSFLGYAAGPFTVSLDRPPVDDVVVTFNDSGNGGTFDPPSVTLTTGNPEAEVFYTPVSLGSRLLRATNDDLINGLLFLSVTMPELYPVSVESLLTFSQPVVSPVQTLDPLGINFLPSFSGPVVAVPQTLQPGGMQFGFRMTRGRLYDLSAIVAPGKIDWMAIKRQTRRIVHDTFSVEGLHSSGVTLNVRWHNKQARFGNLLDVGYAEVIEGLERICFDEDELQAKGVTPAKGQTVLMLHPDWGVTTLVLETREPKVGPIEQWWLVAVKK